MAELQEMQKKGIILAMVAVIVGIVIIGGPASAFYVVGTPVLTHTPGTKDANVTVTIYKERYEAIGDINAQMFGMSTDGDVTNAKGFGAVGTDVNCFAVPDEYYAYTEPLSQTPSANPSTTTVRSYAPWQKSDGTYDYNILAYGYVGNTGTFTAGDPGSAARFLTANPGGLTEAYYGYGYNYAGKFNCKWQFTNLPDAVYFGVKVWINGFLMNTRGFTTQADTVQGATIGDVNAIFAIKTFATSGATDINFVDGSSNKKMYLSIPANAVNSGSGSTVTKGSDFITVDINIASARANSAADITNVPRFRLDSNVASLTFDGSNQATLDLFYTGFFTDAQILSFGTAFNIWKLGTNGAWTKITNGRDINTDIDRVRVIIGSFSEWGFGQDTSAGSGTGGTTTTTGSTGVAGEGGGGGGGGGEPSAPSGVTSVIVGESSETYTPTPEEIIDVLTKAGVSQEQIEKALEAADSTSITKSLQVFKETNNATGEVTYRTEFTIVVRNTSTDTILANVRVVETIPKSVAQSASEISSSYTYSVLVADPVLEFEAPNVRPGQEIKITYSVNKKLDESVLGEFEPTAVIADEKPISAGEEEVTPPTGEVIAPTPGEGVEKPTDLLGTLLVIVIVIVAIAAAYTYFMKKK